MHLEFLVFLSFENADKIQGSTVNGAAPTMAAIADKAMVYLDLFIFMSNQLT